jgi:hypothetical protein
MMNARKTTILSALLLAFACGAAQADTGTDIQYLSTTGITVTTSGTPDGYLTGAMQFITGQGVTFEAYCVELAQGHATNAAGLQTYTLGSFSSSQASLLEGLYSSSYASVTTADQKAAFQTAIWEITQEPAGSALSLSDGSFQYRYLSATSTAAQDSAFGALANSYLQAAASYNGPALFQLNKLVNATYQDYVTATPVPEPAPYAMLLAGLGAVGFVARRRTR